MKTILSLILFVSLSLSVANRAEAIPIFYSWGGEKISTLVDLPNDSSTFADAKRGHVNIGCIYKQFSLFWIPIWNWDVRCCWQYEGDDSTYGELSDEDAKFFAADYGKKLPKPKPDLWNRMSGKVIILAFAAFLVWGSIGGKKEDEEELEYEDETDEDETDEV